MCRGGRLHSLEQQLQRSLPEAVFRGSEQHLLDPDRLPDADDEQVLQRAGPRIEYLKHRFRLFPGHLQPAPLIKVNGVVSLTAFHASHQPDGPPVAKLRLGQRRLLRLHGEARRKQVTADDARWLRPRHQVVENNDHLAERVAAGMPTGDSEVSDPRFRHPVGWHIPSSEPQQGDRPPVAQPAVHDRLIRRFRGTAHNAVFADLGRSQRVAEI